jgi:hypothetical protein
MAAPRPPLYAEPDLVVLAHPEVEPGPQELVQAPEPVQQPVPQPDPEPAAHQLDIVESGAFAHVRCRDCGWQGPARRSRAVAAADGQQHT